MSINHEELIRQSRLIQNEAIARGDVEKAASFWTEDVTLRRGLGSAVSGKEAYRALLDTSLIFERRPSSIEVSTHWPLAFEEGTWVGRRDSRILIQGRYAAQWVLREEKWFIRSEVFVALDAFEEGSDWTALP
ncbi:MAG: nuclear transport factor 2 family protein [Parachlamydiales bacterium]|nr:nuclear transport factor 2 family protein [Parachlamydiales bacterium]